MRLFLHLAILILLAGLVYARKQPPYCADLIANPVESHRRCRKACEQFMKCGWGYCRYQEGNPQLICWCECSKKS